MRRLIALSVIFAMCALGCAADTVDAGSRSAAVPANTNAPALVVPNSTNMQAEPNVSHQPVIERPSSSSSMPNAPMVGGECGAVTQMAQNTLQPVDIIFSVDTSGSMREEVASVKKNLNALSQQIKDSGIDVHVIVISAEGTGMDDGLGGLIFTDGVCIEAPLGSGMCPMDSNPPGYAHIIEVIGQWNILDAYLVHYPDYKQYLRESSVKTFVSISDAEVSLTTADGFIAAVKALEPNSAMWSNWRYSAIYAHSVCGMAEPSAVHADLVARTMGVAGDLCTQQDFAPIFDQIASKLVDVVQVSCDWLIPAPPSGETFEPNNTNVQISLDGAQETLFKTQSADACAMRDGWFYDNETTPTRVMVCPATCARLQSAGNAGVSVLFGCATQILPD